jgi:hypothetical protein
MRDVKELRLKCACVEPFHFVHFCYEIDPDGIVDFFQIEFQRYQGNIWKRIRDAVEMVCTGWVNGTPNWSCIDRKRIEELRDFCNQCLDESQPKEWEPCRGEKDKEPA